MGRWGEREDPRFDEMRPTRADFEAGLTAEDRAVVSSTTAATRPARRRGDPIRREPDFTPVLDTRRHAGGETLARGSDEGRGRNGSGRRRRRERRSVLGRLLYWSVTLGVWVMLAVGGVVTWHAMKLPPIDQLAVPKRPPNIAILAEDGSLIANRGETGGSTVAIGELPKYLPQAFVSIEDRRFYSHLGIDPQGLLRATVRNIGAGRLAEGGSTLTQQLAKNLFLTQERTASRKIQEAILAVWLERRYGKDQILELYLNRVYFGSGAYGVEAAAQRYFGKPARAVTLAEAAVLAGLVQAPSRLAPSRNPKGAADRAALVLAAMARDGAIGDAAAKIALASPAQARRQSGAGSANYAADWIIDVLDDYIGAVDQDVVIRTTIAPLLQAAAERALVAELDAKGAKAGVGQGAVVVLAPDGAIRAMVGGRNYAESQFNRAVAARRQPGSAFKPFVYLAALEKGWMPDDPLLDAPINIRGWTPENYTREYFGEVPLRRALAMSLNTAVIRLEQQVGVRTVVRTAQRLGISSPLQANASLALGTSEVTPLELTAAYAAFANGGIGVIPHIIQSVKTTSGKLIYQRQPQGLGRVVEPDQVLQMNMMLGETLASGTGKRADLPGWPAAGKTGTTQEYRDAWFVGYTAQLVAAVWLGNDDGEPTRRVSGSGLPVDVWNRFMREAHKGLTPVALPGLAAPAFAQDQAIASTGGRSGTGAGAPIGVVSRGQPLRPPAPIPGSGSDADPGRPLPLEKGLLGRLFGG